MTAERNRVVNWKKGEDVTIVGPVSDEEAKRTYPQGWKTPKAYLRAIRAGGVNPVVSNLRLQKTPSADSSLQHGSTGIDRVSPHCADGLRKYWPKYATVHRGGLQALVARPESHGVNWAYLGAEVQGPPDHLPLQRLLLANAASGLDWPLHA